MIDIEGGNNLLYLPLDKILESKKKDDEVIDATSPNTSKIFDRKNTKKSR